MNSLVAALGDRAIGTVEQVSAGGISVLLDPNAPQATALNTGTPAGFPRINGYLLVPNESGATVGVITKVEVARLPYPKRRGMQDFGLVDLPFPALLVFLTPVGTILVKSGSSVGDLSFEVRRGVDVFPSVGGPVVLPTEAQLRAIVEGKGADQAHRIQIGVCPTAANAPVYVDPDKLFGRHLAVLGNTGAGKSCSVAGLIRWSLDAARKARSDAGRDGNPNACFIILDPNGEYAQAFREFNARLFQVEPQGGASALKVPAWLWNGEEWAAFTGAAPGVQRPILFDAIRRLRCGVGVPDTFKSQVRVRCKRYQNRLRLAIDGGAHQGAGRREDVAQILINLQRDFQDLAAKCGPGELKSKLETVATKAAEVENAARSNVDRTTGKYWHNDFAEAQLEEVKTALAEVAAAISLSSWTR